MTEALTPTPDRSARKRRDEETAPFVLDRSSVRPPPEPSTTASHEEDAIVDLVARRSDPIAPMTALEPPSTSPPSGSGSGSDEIPTAAPEASPSGEQALPARASGAPSLPLDRPGRRALRLVSWALALDGLVLLTLSGAAAARLTREGAGAPDLLLAGVALVLALPSLLGANLLFRVGRRGSTETLDARRFSQGIGHLRAIFVIKATVLFTTLGLGCFVFSLVASLLALL